MRDILFLAHRIPYPPDKGEKIRAWNILRYLASRHRVHLGIFIDVPEDVRHVDKLKSICASVFWQPLSPRLATLRSLRGLLTGKSLTQAYFGDAKFRSNVDEIVARHKPDVFYVFSSAMAPYVAHHRSAARIIVDMVDVDSEKWRQYAQMMRWPARSIYKREGRSLLALERQAAEGSDAVIFVTRAEATLFSRLAPEANGHTHSLSNGVDVDYFDPSLDYANPLGDRPAIVFTGVMDYRPNVDAMTWFVGHVMPLLRDQPNPPQFWIVGANPNRAVRSLAGTDVRVTGRVADVRPYLSHAKVVVAPLRIARGVQNKVLEAMAMGKAVVVTPQIRQTLDYCGGDEVLTAGSAEEFAEAVQSVLLNGATQIGQLARKRVARHYHWQSSFALIDELIEPRASGSGNADSTALATALSDVG